MKRKICIFCLILGAVILKANPIGNELFEQLIFGVELTNPTGNLGERPRTPIVCPNVSQDGHTLYFNNVGYDLELVLLDEDGEEAYAVFVPANTASVILPASLSGDYELQLYPGGSYYFYSDITL